MITKYTEEGLPILPEKPTRNDYREAVSKYTERVNLRLYEYRQSGKKSRVVEEDIKRLQLFGAKPSPTRRSETIGKGIRGKSKARLKRQYEELKRVYDKDYFTPEGRRKRKKKRKDSWKAFKENHPDWNKSKWQTFVDTFGNISDTIKSQFGYEVTQTGHNQQQKRGKKRRKISNQDLIDAFEVAYEKNVDLLKIMEEVLKENKGKGLTQKKAVDKLLKKLKDYG